MDLSLIRARVFFRHKDKLSDCSSTAQSTMLASTQMPMLGVTASDAKAIVKGLMKVIGIAEYVINTGEDATAKIENAVQPIIMQVASIMNSIMNIIGISDDEALKCMETLSIKVLMKSAKITRAFLTGGNATTADSNRRLKQGKCSGMKRIVCSRSSRLS